MAQPAHHFLKDFTVQLAEPAAAEPAAATREAALKRQQLAREEQLQEAYRRGYEDGRNETRAEADAERDRIGRLHAREMALLRQQLAAGVADALVESLERGIAQASETIMTSTADALRPMAREALTRAVIDDMSRRLAAILSEGAMKVHLKGPLHLVQALSSRVLPPGEDAPSAGPQIRTQIADDTELYVDVDGTLIQSKIAEWLKQIDEA